MKDGSIPARRIRLCFAHNDLDRSTREALLPYCQTGIALREQCVVVEALAIPWGEGGADPVIRASAADVRELS